MSKETRETITWVLNEVTALEAVLQNLKNGLLEDLRTDAREKTSK